MAFTIMMSFNEKAIMIFMTNIKKVPFNNIYMHLNYYLYYTLKIIITKSNCPGFELWLLQW